MCLFVTILLIFLDKCGANFAYKPGTTVNIIWVNKTCFDITALAFLRITWDLRIWLWKYRLAYLHVRNGHWINLAAYNCKIVLYASCILGSWWRHQMETFSALLALCAGNSPVPVNSPHKGQWRGALMFSLICVWINDWVNNREAGDLRRYRGHYDVNLMTYVYLSGPRGMW